MTCTLPWLIPDWNEPITLCANKPPRMAHREPCKSCAQSPSICVIASVVRTPCSGTHTSRCPRSDAPRSGGGTRPCGRGVHFLSVDHVVVTVAHCAAAQARQIGPARRFGEARREGKFQADQLRHEMALLFLRARRHDGRRAAAAQADRNPTLRNSSSTIYWLIRSPPCPPYSFGWAMPSQPPA